MPTQYLKVEVFQLPRLAILPKPGIIRVKLNPIRQGLGGVGANRNGIPKTIPV
jgi:hypothetical protein